MVVVQYLTINTVLAQAIKRTEAAVLGYQIIIPSTGSGNWGYKRPYWKWDLLCSFIKDVGFRKVVGQREFWRPLCWETISMHRQKEQAFLPLRFGWRGKLTIPPEHQRRENHLCLMVQHLLFIKRLNITHHSWGKKAEIWESVQKSIRRRHVFLKVANTLRGTEMKKAENITHRRNNSGGEENIF